MADGKKAVKIVYTNYKGETAERTIIPLELWFGSTEYHKEEQWLLKAFDFDKKAERNFAVKDIKSWEGHTKFNKELVDAHEQKYVVSCIPSAIEMILKMLGKVNENYYELQDFWKNKTNGSFADFDGKTVNNVTFEAKFRYARDTNFPIDNLFKTIDSELSDGRFVIISLHTLCGWHMYVIFDKLGDEYLAFTKEGKITQIISDVKSQVRMMRGTDILSYAPA